MPTAMEVLLLAVLVVVLVVLARSAHRRSPEEELEALFGERSTPEPGPRARAWAWGALFAAGVDPDADPPYAARMLRLADPRLSRSAARLLIDTLNRA